jgi:large subunit GTPase 1
VIVISSGAVDPLALEASAAERAAVAARHADDLKIPRRPAWDARTTPEELDTQEKASFLEWRRWVGPRSRGCRGRVAGVQLLLLLAPAGPPVEEAPSGASAPADQGGAPPLLRRRLAHLEEAEKLVLTPFERNLEVWRQLWRVLERSDIVVQASVLRTPRL